MTTERNSAATGTAKRGGRGIRSETGRRALCSYSVGENPEKMRLPTRLFHTYSVIHSTALTRHAKILRGTQALRRIRRRREGLTAEEESGIIAVGEEPLKPGVPSGSGVRLSTYSQPV